MQKHTFLYVHLHTQEHTCKNSCPTSMYRRCTKRDACLSRQVRVNPLEQDLEWVQTEDVSPFPYVCPPDDLLGPILQKDHIIEGKGQPPYVVL